MSQDSAALACRVAKRPQQVLSNGRRAAIVTASSENLAELPDGTVDLVLTDPPYFDNISYSELSDFYLAWHQTLGVAEHPYRSRAACAPIAANLAITKRTDEQIASYGTRLTGILSQCNRVLKPDGVCVFTYHHRSPAAWLALGESLARSGLKCTAVIPMRGEGQGGLHSHDGTIKWDAVFVCRRIKGVVRGSRAVVVPAICVAHATKKAGAFRELLQKQERIAFRTPDYGNLVRGIIVSYARLGPLRGAIPLQAALARISD